MLSRASYLPRGHCKAQEKSADWDHCRGKEQAYQYSPPLLMRGDNTDLLQLGDASLRGKNA